MPSRGRATPISESPERSESSVALCQPDIVAQCFREAEMQRLSDNKLVLENASLYLRSRGNSAAAKHFSHTILNGRYRANNSLGEACRVQDTVFTYSELITDIAWELTDNCDSLAALEVESVDSFMLLLETASMYEAEIGKVASSNSIPSGPGGLGWLLTRRRLRWLACQLSASDTVLTD